MYFQNFILFFSLLQHLVTVLNFSSFCLNFAQNPVWLFQTLGSRHWLEAWKCESHQSLSCSHNKAPRVHVDNQAAELLPATTGSSLLAAAEQKVQKIKSQIWNITFSINITVNRIFQHVKFYFTAKKKVNKKLIICEQV